MVIGYLFLGLAFASTIVAIFGNTWKPEEKGIGKLTLTGWITILVATTVLGLSCHTLYKTNSDDKREADLFREKMAANLAGVYIKFVVGPTLLCKDNCSEFYRNSMEVYGKQLSRHEPLYYKYLNEFELKIVDQLEGYLLGENFGGRSEKLDELQGEVIQNTCTAAHEICKNVIKKDTSGCFTILKLCGKRFASGTGWETMLDKGP